MFMAVVIPLVCTFPRRTESVYQREDKANKLLFYTGVWLRPEWLLQAVSAAMLCFGFITKVASITHTFLFAEQYLHIHYQRMITSLQLVIFITVSQKKLKSDLFQCMSIYLLYLKDYFYFDFHFIIFKRFLLRKSLLYARYVVRLLTD